MEEFQTYTPEDIVFSNLEELFLRAVQNCEQQQAHLLDLAEETVSHFTDSASFLESLSEHRLHLPFPKEPCPPSLMRSIDAEQRILFAKALRDKIPEEDSLLRELIGSGTPTAEDTPSAFQRICYQRNLYTDTAYQQFAALLPAARAAYAHSFSSVCEDVYNGVCEYCILPVENSAEGRLNSFSLLIDKYDLKIAATCEVQAGEDRTTVFALLRKTACIQQAPEQLPRYFEFSCDLSDSTHAEDLLRASDFFGLSLNRSEISSRNQTPLQFHATLLVGSGDLPAFLIYLAMELPSANILGYYPHIPLHKNSRLKGFS